MSVFSYFAPRRLIRHYTVEMTKLPEGLFSCNYGQLLWLTLYQQWALMLTSTERLLAADTFYPQTIRERKSCLLPPPPRYVHSLHRFSSVSSQTSPYVWAFIGIVLKRRRIRLGNETKKICFFIAVLVNVALQRVFSYPYSGQPSFSAFPFRCIDYAWVLG